MSKKTSGTQGLSGKNVKVGEMFSDRGPQIVTASDKVEVDVMDNRGYKPRRLPFGSIKIGEFTLFKGGFSFVDSFFNSILQYFKNKP
jgi:hypothetical protein